MPFALALASTLGIATAALAVLLAGAAAYFYVQARRRKAADAEREAHAARQRDAELRTIRQRLEEIYERQQTGSETQLARVNQELEDLHTSLDAKGRQIDGVQGQLRYELQRQEEEIALLRNQLREAIEVFAAAALPAARPAAAALPAPPPAEPEVAAEPEVMKEDAELLSDLFGNTGLDADAGPEEQPAPDAQRTPEDERGFTARPLVDAPVRTETNDDFAFVEIARPTAPRPAPIPWNRLDEIPTETHDDPAETEPRPSTHSGDGMGDAPLVDAFAAPAPTLRRAFVVEDQTAPIVPDTDAALADETDVSAAPAPSSEHLDPSELVTVAAPGAVPGTEMLTYDDLTVLSAVDAAVQQKLYALGITTVEAIARWSRADARRIASQLPHTSEEDIMDRWIFEAQAVLFDRYQEELRTQRRQRLTG